MEGRKLSKLLVLEEILEKVGMACLGLLILQVSLEFLPFTIVLKYLTTTRIILLLGFASLIGTYIIKHKKQINRKKTFQGLTTLLGLITLFLTWCLISSLFSRSAISFSIFRLQLEQVFAFLFVILKVDSEEKIRAVLFILCLATTAISLHAINQFSESENTHYFLILREGSWTVTETLEVPKNGIIRVLGYFNNPNVLGAYLILAIPLATCYFHYSRVPIWVIGSIVALAWVALLLTFSRSCLISLLFALSVTLGRKKPFALVCLAVLTGVTLVNPLSIGRLATGYARVSAWSTTIELISEKPIFGVGLGNFRAYSGGFWHAHNLFLHIAAEAGLIAGILLTGIFMIALVRAFRLGHGCDGAGPLGQAFSVAFLAFAIASLVDNAYNTTPISYTFWILFGLLIAACGVFERQQQASRIGE